MKKSSSSGIAFIIVGLVLFGGIFYLIITAGSRAEKRYASMSAREVALICTTDMATRFHVHPELAIVIRGEERIIPANIGVTSTCMNSLHTHDATGILHVESPVQKDFTLADFFAVWQQPFDADHILDATRVPQETLSVTVNGEPVATFSDTLLRDKDKIVIMLGQ